MNRIVELYGPLRDLDPGGSLQLHLLASARPAEVRAEVLAWAQRRPLATPGGTEALARLLERTVVAADDALLAEGDQVGAAPTLALVPPVCGG